MNGPDVTLEPVVNWPREVTVGKTYLVTADIRLAGSSAWPYNREEFVIGCVLEGGSTFSVEAPGSTGLVLHRFGGTYGPVEFLIQALRPPAAGGADQLRLTFVTQGGVPFRVVSLPVRSAGDAAEATSTLVTITTGEAVDNQVPGSLVTAPRRQAIALMDAEAAILARDLDTHPDRIDELDQQERRRALLIGTGTSTQDVTVMSEVLAGLGFAVARCEGDAATRTGILAAYEHLIRGSRPDDAVFVYFSGLGGVIRPPHTDTTIRFVMPIDYGNAGAGDFRGVITETELAERHSQLAAVTPNVTVAFDCMYAETPRPAFTDPRVDDTVLGLAFRQPVHPPAVVRLSACGDGQVAFAHLSGQSMIGVFTDALTRTLAEMSDRPVTWAVVMERISRRVRNGFPQQRPEIEGPVRRVVFGLDEADPESTLPVSTRGDGRLVLDGGPLLGVQVGDEFAIMPAGAVSPDEDTKICDARVETLTLVAAVAVATGDPPPIPVGARAHRTRVSAMATPVGLPPDDPRADDLRMALAASNLVRPAEPDEPHPFDVRIDQPGMLTIHDRLGPLQDARPADRAGSEKVMRDLEKLARAHTLRILGEDPGWTLDHAVDVSWGRVVDGRREPLPTAGTRMHAGEHAYVEVSNRGPGTVYVSMINIGIAAEITVLTQELVGTPLEAGMTFLVGTDARGTLRGLRLVWPERLDARQARPETILVLVTSAPLDVAVLEQRGLREVRRSPSSALESALAQIATGAARRVLAPTEQSARYAVLSIDFWLDPTPPATAVPPTDKLPTELLPTDQLRELARQVRSSVLRMDEVVTDEMVSLIEDQVEEYRRRYPRQAEFVPPEELSERLIVIGWLIYEASLSQLWAIQSGFDSFEGPAYERSRSSAQAVRRLANAARRLPWPHFAPRALGAIRAQALVESKKDTEAGYEEAWILHAEARLKYDAYREGFGEGPEYARERLALDEVFLQLALAETGTACRIAERVISQWTEEGTEDLGRKWTGRVFRQLSEGATVGEKALGVGARIAGGAGFVLRVTEDRLALQTTMRNPAIMTSRALLMLYSTAPEPAMLERIDRALRFLLEPVQREDREPWPLNRDHLRSLVQILLHLALVAPGHRLAERIHIGDGLAVRDLDDAAVEALSGWLAESVDGRQRGDANVIGSATMPAFVVSVERCRQHHAASTSYYRWRRRWPSLDRYVDVPGRRERIDLVLRAAASQLPPIEDDGHRFVVVVDTVRAPATREPSDERRLLREVMNSAATTAGWDLDTLPVRDTGDGFIVGLPASTSAETAAVAFVDGLGRALGPARLRLRVAVHHGYGTISTTDHGWVGEAVVTASRLVDAIPLRSAMTYFSGANLALIVSDGVYRRLAGTATFASFTPTLVVAKESVVTAWIRMPGVDLPPGFGTDVLKGRSDPDWKTALRSIAPTIPAYATEQHEDGSFRSEVLVGGARFDGSPEATSDEAEQQAAKVAWPRIVLASSSRFASSIVMGAGGGGVSGMVTPAPVASPAVAESDATHQRR